jgi:protoporphyrinogen oxidase
MEKERVAVVGTGPAGLVAAFCLQNDLENKFDVTVFEMVCPSFTIESTQTKYSA